MNNFTFCTPTKVVFGRDIEGQIGPALQTYGAKKVLLHFGGGSVRASGLLKRSLTRWMQPVSPMLSWAGFPPTPS